MFTGYSAALLKLRRSRAALPETTEHDSSPLLELDEYGVRPAIIRSFAAAAPASVTFVSSIDTYEYRLEKIQKYFRREVRELKGLSNTARSSEDIELIERHTSSLVAQTEEFERTICDMRMPAALVMFVVDAVWTATLGILTSLDMWYGSILILVLFGLLVLEDIQHLLTLISPGLQRFSVT